MRPAIPETETDRRAWAELWSATLDPWDRALDLADLLGVCRSAVQQYGSGARRGPWPALRAAMRGTARRHPERVPHLVQAFARAVLDVRGTWVPDVSAEELLCVTEEVGDVTVACGRLLTACRTGAAPEVVSQLAQELVREAMEASAVARQMAKGGSHG